jgi:hypothetical protein
MNCENLGDDKLLSGLGWMAIADSTFWESNGIDCNLASVVVLGYRSDCG